MVNVRKLIYALPWLQVAPQTYLSDTQSAQSILGFTGDPGRIEETKQKAYPRVSKSIAVIGAGSGGLSAIKTFLDVADTVQQTWDIVVFEQRRDVGGVW